MNAMNPIHRLIAVSTLALATVVVTAAPAAAQDVTKQAKAVLARFNVEPDVREVQNAAARYARVNPGAYESWLTAASFAYLLPDRVKGLVESERDDGQDLRSSLQSGTLSELRTEDNEMILRLDLWWNFSRLVFNPDKIRLAREISRLVDQREDILTTVNKIYFARREQQASMIINPPTDIRTAVRRQLQIDALTADLDALTGGWFSRQLKK